MSKTKSSIGIDAVVMAIYFAVTPIHQTLFLSNGTTAVKMIAFAVMLMILLVSFFRNRKVVFSNTVLYRLGYILLVFFVTIFWSESTSSTITALISIASYCLLFLLITSKEWSKEEKLLVQIFIIIGAVYFSIGLFTSVSVMKRATYVSASGVEADVNLLSVDIAIGAVIALYWFYKNDIFLIRIVFIAVMGIITLGIICTGSRGGLIAEMCGLLYLIYSFQHENKKSTIKTIAICLIVFIGLYIFFFSGLIKNNEIISRFTTDYKISDGSGRFEIWGKYLEILFYHPWIFITGGGYGAVANVYTGFYHNRYPPVTHNDILQIVFGAGLIGLYEVITFVKMCWNQSNKYKDMLGKSMMIVLLIGGLDVNLFNSYGWWNAMILAYIGIGVIDKNETKES